MKKLLVTICIILCCLPLLSASDDAFLSFQMFNSKSLYYQSPSDLFNAASTLEIMMIQEGQPRTVRAYPEDSSGQYEDLPIFTDGKYEDENLYARLKTGVDVSVFRLGLFREKAQMELAFSGSLNSIFQGFGGADNLGFDGIFFFGPQLQLFDLFTVKFGLQHYSGHYGDETIDNYVSVNGGEKRELLSYTRDNNLFLGVSVEPVKNLHVKFEATRPRLNTWMGPSVHIPSWVLKPSNGQPLNPIAADNENVPASVYPDSYKAWTLQSGISYEIALTRQIGLVLSGDLKLHQDGQTMHQIGMYDEDNPWEREYTFTAGLDLFDIDSLHRALILVTYHDGRLPLLNYFYQRTKYVSVSVQIG
ncbi:MAG: hypothetical protein PQJ47_11775 [Sphaerochaetaceae bacterium]|nr:hypothetical protein [Sphaerochaetaceae bacterium]MDC7247671.1 hypothetical protein [Sphaerochaetaceae bacterium]